MERGARMRKIVKLGGCVHDSSRLKAGSQSDARPCVTLIRKMHKFIAKKVGGFLTIRRKNTTQKHNARGRKDRIRVYPSVVLRFYKH